MDRTGYRAAGTAEISLDLAGRRGFSPGGDARKLHFRPLAYGRQPDIDDLDRLARRMGSVALIVQPVKSGPDGTATRRLAFLRGDAHGKREFLADGTAAKAKLVRRPSLPP